MPSRYDRFRTHRRSRRLAGHDYAAPGWTFVTVCTADRRCLFGEVRNGVMGLNDCGCLAHACWVEIPDHIGSVRLGAFVVMPNHVHGLIGIVPPAESEAPSEVERRSDPMARLAPVVGSVSVVVRSYKAAVTRAARLVDPAFAWQPRFHDHVVRSDRDLRHVQAYIASNPARWDVDRFHPRSGEPR